jgi:transposase-like protein
MADWTDEDRARVVAAALEAGKVTRCAPGYAYGAEPTVARRAVYITGTWRG